MKFSTTAARRLHFDAECLPGHWIGGDFVSKLITAIAASWADSDVVWYWTHFTATRREMLEEFSELYTEADLVTGHYIRGFDLPLFNGNRRRAGLGPLGDKMTLDTKLDLLRAGGRSSSQENLAAELRIAEPKVKVTLVDWEDFNVREPGAEQHGIDRVVGDVVQHKAMTEELLRRGWLGSARPWSSSRHGGSGIYTP